MVTVITACYNSANSISRAIESLLQQTDREFEHIIVDGKSTDATLSIIEQYRPVYEKLGIRLVVISEKDNGMYDAINKGIQLANGDHIGILNSDDTYPSNTIETVNSEFSHHPNIDVLMGSGMIINGTSRILKKSGIGVNGYITSRQFNHGSMFVKKSCYEDIGGYENDGNYYDDFMWYIKAIKGRKNFRIIEDNLYDFYCGGMSTRKSLSEVFVRIKYRYAAYRKNHCSRMYVFECVAMEFAKWLVVKK